MDYNEAEKEIVTLNQMAARVNASPICLPSLCPVHFVLVIQQRAEIETQHPPQVCKRVHSSLCHFAVNTTRLTLQSSIFKPRPPIGDQTSNASIFQDFPIRFRNIQQPIKDELFFECRVLSRQASILFKFRGGYCFIIG